MIKDIWIICCLSPPAVVTLSQVCLLMFAISPDTIRYHSVMVLFPWLRPSYCLSHYSCQGWVFLCRDGPYHMNPRISRGPHVWTDAAKTCHQGFPTTVGGEGTTECQCRPSALQANTLFSTPTHYKDSSASSGSLSQHLQEQLFKASTNLLPHLLTQLHLLDNKPYKVKVPQQSNHYT